jgi:hypothetical protein
MRETINSVTASAISPLTAVIKAAPPTTLAFVLRGRTSDFRPAEGDLMPYMLTGVFTLQQCASLACFSLQGSCIIIASNQKSDARFTQVVKSYCAMHT